MKLIVIIFLSLFSGLCFSQTFNGSIKLDKGSFFDSNEPTITYENNDISFSVKFYVDTFIEDTAIYAYTKVKNLSGKDSKYAFYVAFFDTDENLVATSRHTTKLKPGEDTQLGGLYSEIAGDDWKKVTSYKYTVVKL